ncbi:hypothetical protein AG1IA_08845 [Rhizoctonia solani AG-1 IA]|uniref:Uncharacterized protein n=1 Tax=Thanatephorus cucumeris (strain AG1-IA) TaxID=983506 RepID=L8WLB1_THACA|nr:hypothetical protein AG1IA_08845 [Rhizoctonia solani AG-1 IA]
MTRSSRPTTTPELCQLMIALPRDNPDRAKRHFWDRRLQSICLDIRLNRGMVSLLQLSFIKGLEGTIVGVYQNLLVYFATAENMDGYADQLPVGLQSLHERSHALSAIVLVCSFVLRPAHRLFGIRRNLALLRRGRYAFVLERPRLDI